MDAISKFVNWKDAVQVTYDKPPATVVSIVISPNDVGNAPSILIYLLGLFAAVVTTIVISEYNAS